MAGSHRTGLADLFSVANQVLGPSPEEKAQASIEQKLQADQMLHDQRLQQNLTFNEMNQRMNNPAVAVSDTMQGQSYGQMETAAGMLQGRADLLKWKALNTDISSIDPVDSNHFFQTGENPRQHAVRLAREAQAIADRARGKLMSYAANPNYTQGILQHGLPAQIKQSGENFRHLVPGSESGKPSNIKQQPDGSFIGLQGGMIRNIPTAPGTNLQTPGILSEAVLRQKKDIAASGASVINLKQPFETERSKVLGRDAAEQEVSLRKTAEDLEKNYMLVSQAVSDLGDSYTGPLSEELLTTQKVASSLFPRTVNGGSLAKKEQAYATIKRQILAAGKQLKGDLSQSELQLIKDAQQVSIGMTPEAIRHGLELIERAKNKAALDYKMFKGNNPSAYGVDSNQSMTNSDDTWETGGIKYKKVGNKTYKWVE